MNLCPTMYSETGLGDMTRIPKGELSLGKRDVCVFKVISVCVCVHACIFAAYMAGPVGVLGRDGVRVDCLSDIIRVVRRDQL